MTKLPRGPGLLKAMVDQLGLKREDIGE